MQAVARTSCCANRVASRIPLPTAAVFHLYKDMHSQNDHYQGLEHGSPTNRHARSTDHLGQSTLLMRDREAYPRMTLRRYCNTAYAVGRPRLQSNRVAFVAAKLQR